MKIKEPPLCSCGRPCWRPGHMVEMEMPGGRLRAMTFCMWCSSVWALEELGDGIVKCVEPNDKERASIERDCGEMIARQKYNHRLAKTLGLTFEEFLEKVEPNTEEGSKTSIN